MKNVFKLIFCLLLVFCCTSKNSTKQVLDVPFDLVIAFGSCNKQNSENKLWKEIIKHHPKAWIWGGDVVYADTDDMTKLKADYDTQLQQKDYNKILANTKILGTWDDHDYGLNDGGEEFKVKAESQQLFLDFIGVDKNSSRRNREGVYHSEVLKTKQGTVKVIILDTRYFRTALTKSDIKKKRYIPNVDGEGTVLGAAQWQWFEGELNTSKADFNLIVSSIQLLSNAHGFETWGNFPHEVDKMKQLIANTTAKGVLIVSGDRHISEFSKIKVEGLAYPLIDFTSSGLTHSYTSYDNEPNPFRIGSVISEISFGLLKFDFKTRTICMEMRGENNKKQQELIQVY